MRLIFGIASLFALSGCIFGGGNSLDTRQNAGPCPPSGSLYDVSRIVVFDGPTKTYSNIAYTGEIVGVDLYCRYADADDMDVELEIDFAFGRGEKGVPGRHSYEYFVAVARRGGRVLAKETFAIEADLRRDPVAGVSEIISPIKIPRADETVSGANFEVLVGFVMTDEQKQFNRDGNRFRLSTQ